MPVLSHRSLGGEGRPPLVILHGMLGSSRNWQGAGAGLASHFHVHALDLRDHGDSFHAASTSYAEMVGDLLEWLDHHRIRQVRVIGHSMGGKVGMLMACRLPERVSGLVVVDIAPRAYPGTHEHTFRALNGLDLKALTSRSEAEAKLAAEIPDLETRRFLLSNLRRKAGGGWEWMVNLAGLARSMQALEDEFLGPEDGTDMDVLFVLGGKSSYFRSDDGERVKHHFPNARFETIPASGHNPHIEARDEFLELVERFLK